MRLKPSAQREWWAGWAFIAIGIIALTQIRNYRIAALEREQAVEAD